MTPSTTRWFSPIWSTPNLQFTHAFGYGEDLLIAILTVYSLMYALPADRSYLWNSLTFRQIWQPYLALVQPNIRAIISIPVQHPHLAFTPFRASHNLHMSNWNNCGEFKSRLRIVLKSPVNLFLSYLMLFSVSFPVSLLKNDKRRFEVR